MLIIPKIIIRTLQVGVIVGITVVAHNQYLNYRQKQYDMHSQQQKIKDYANNFKIKFF
jgi:uncharacterized membrane protein YebE (DUF533 family)